MAQQIPVRTRPGAMPGQSMVPPGQTEERPTAKEFFVYEIDFSALAASGSSSDSFNIQADSDFVLQKMTYFADIAAAAQTDSSRIVPDCTVLITNTGSGRQLMSQAVPLASIFGTGVLPFILPTPYPFQSRSTVSVTVANFSAGTTYNIRLSFIGYKLYYL
jgi:hypothetical protein